MQALNTAGVDEEAFHLAIEALRDAPGLSDESVMNITKGYIGDPLPLADREATLGAIETEFHEGKSWCFPARVRTLMVHSCRSATERIPSPSLT